MATWDDDSSDSCSLPAEVKRAPHQDRRHPISMRQIWRHRSDRRTMTSHDVCGTVWYRGPDAGGTVKTKPKSGMPVVPAVPEAASIAPSVGITTAITYVCIYRPMAQVPRVRGISGRRQGAETGGAGWAGRWSGLGRGWGDYHLARRSRAWSRRRPGAGVGPDDGNRA